MSQPDRMECDEILLNHHVSLKGLLTDMEDLLRVNKFEDEDVKNELVFVKERVDMLVQESLLDYQRFRL